MTVCGATWRPALQAQWKKSVGLLVPMAAAATSVFMSRLTHASAQQTSRRADEFV
jgi:hypothetical protein